MRYRVETIGEGCWVLARDAAGLLVDDALRVFGSFVRIGESARIVLEGAEETVIATTVVDVPPRDDFGGRLLDDLAELHVARRDREPGKHGSLADCECPVAADYRELRKREGLR